MKKMLLTGLITGVMSFVSLSASAQINYYPAPNQNQLVTQTLPNSYFTFSSGVKSLDLKGYHYVETLTVSAEGINHKGSFTVNVNNEIKQTIHVPGRDPNYIVTIRAYVNSIQFVHMSGNIKVSSVTALLTPPVNDCVTPQPTCTTVPPVTTTPACTTNTCTTPVAPVIVPVYGSYSNNEPSNVALKAIGIVDQLRMYTNDEEIVRHLTPIKASASQLYATAQVRSGLSESVRTKLKALMDQIGNSMGYIESNYQRTAVYGLALELTALYSKIDLMLR